MRTLQEWDDFFFISHRKCEFYLIILYRLLIITIYQTTLVCLHPLATNFPHFYLGLSIFSSSLVFILGGCCLNTQNVFKVSINSYSKNKLCKTIWHISADKELYPWKIKFNKNILKSYYLNKFLIDKGIKNADYIIAQTENQNISLKRRYSISPNLIVKNFHPIPLSPTVKSEKIKVNSAHHQSINNLGKDLVTSALAVDGIIEAIEHINHPWCIGLQWHPEFLITKADNAIIENFVSNAK